MYTHQKGAAKKSDQNEKHADLKVLQTWESDISYKVAVAQVSAFIFN